MSMKRRATIIIPVLVVLLGLTACRSSIERYELTNFIGNSEAAFAKKSGLELEEQDSGVYLMENVAQIMTTEKEVTSVTLLKNAGEYKVFGVGIGMKKEEADKLLSNDFGSEIAKTIDSANNAITYSYLKDQNELYISYDIDKNTVIGLSYYKVSGSKKEEETDNSLNNGELIAMVGDTRIYYNEAMVYLKSAQGNYETEYGKDIWNADILGNGVSFGTMLKNEIINQITELKIIRAQAGAEGITLSEEEVAEANSYAKEHYDGLNSEDKVKYLITPELLQQIYSDNLLANKMFEVKTINVDTNVPDEEAKQITVQDILIYSKHYDENGNEVLLTEEEKQEAYAKVQNLSAQAKTTEDFYALAEANSEAEAIEFTFGKGEAPKDYSAAFEQTAFKLKTGQVSSIITTDYGWHIIYCVSDYNEDATIQVKESIIEERRNQMFADLYAEWSKDYDVVINDEAWKAVTFQE